MQELRVIETGVQILSAFLLSIAFQARFAQTSPFQRHAYLVTLLFSGLATTLLIAPVAVHRLPFRIGVKDEVVSLTSTLAVAGLAVLSIAVVGAVVLTSDWVAGGVAGTICGVGSTVVLGAGWFALPLLIRRQDTHSRLPRRAEPDRPGGCHGGKPLSRKPQR